TAPGTRGPEHRQHAQHACKLPLRPHPLRSSPGVGPVSTLRQLTRNRSLKQLRCRVMQRTSFSDMACSLARSLDVAGEWWTPLVVRDLWMGRHRFEEIQRNLEVSRKLLTDRLDTLVSEGVVERRQYLEHPPRY